MDATPQDFVGPGNGRIGELDGVEIGLHGPRLYPWIHAARVEDPHRIESALEGGRERHERRIERLEHLDAGSRRGLGADQGGMASEFGNGTANLDRTSIGNGRRFEPDEAAGPIIKDADVDLAREAADEFRRWWTAPWICATADDRSSGTS